MTTHSPAPVKFLLVDDLEENLLALEGLLRRDGLMMFKARTGNEALELLLLHEFALAIVDVQMPGMDGFELAELMRGTERTRRVPIIFLTAGSADSQRRFRGYEAGAVDFLHKPIEADVLRGKATVFFELWRERHEVARQRDELRVIAAENARLLEDSRRVAESLREADRRKDEFLATLAHELRNPLAPIRNGLQILRLTRLDDLDVRDRTQEMMERQFAQLVHLIDDLLDVARVSSGKITLRRDLFSLREVVDAAVEACRPILDEKRHAFEAHVPPGEWLVDGDRTRLTQVLSNLLTNAAKYSEPGGRVKLAVGREGALAAISVSDTGVGIAPELLPTIWDMFTQVRDTLDKAQGGLGIGLTLVRRLMEMHGGSVAAHSEGSGRGSTFTVRLPLSRTVGVAESSGSEDSDAPAVDSEPVGARRVLVVDDNVDGANSLGTLLRMAGHETAISHTGQDGVQDAISFRPDIVFIDIGLPGMDGYQVAQRLRQEPRTARAMLVALTGWGSEDDKRRAHASGFDAHLTKPVKAEVLRSILANLTS